MAAVEQKKLVTRCFECNRFGHWSGDPICPAKDRKDALAHVSRVVCCRKQCMFILSYLSRAQFRLNKSSEEPERATLAVIAPLLVRSGWTTVHSLKKAEVEALDAVLLRTFQVLEQVTPVVCKTAYFIPVLIHGACAIMRVFLVPGKLMLLIGKDTVKVLEARFDLKNNTGFFQVLQVLRAKCCEKAAQVT